MAKLKLINTIFSKLSSLKKNNGQLIVAKDSKSMYVDFENERIEITDYIDIDTEETLLAILTPLTNKYYYTKDTNKVWKYYNSKWNCLNPVQTVGDGVITFTQNGVVKGSFSVNQNKDTILELSDSDTWRPLETEITSEDLNDITNAGFYYAGGANKALNKPSGVSYFGLQVIHVAVGKYYVQKLFTDKAQYTRKCVNNIWEDWSEDKLDNTWRGIQNNLISDSTSDSLSAAQGKLLKSLIDEKANSDHTHNYNDLSNKPTSLPANGGIADEAKKLSVARKIDLTGDVTGTGNFDGTSNLNLQVKRRNCIIGQKTVANTEKPYYKFASMTSTTGYDDKLISFKVYRGYQDDTTCVGILTAHFRTKANLDLQDGQLVWEYANAGINPNDFFMCYKQNINSNLDVQLFAKIDINYTYYHFEVLAEGTRTSNETCWTLYNHSSDGELESFPDGYTAITSTCNTIINNISGEANKAINDSIGQQIENTYIKNLSISGQNIIFTKGNDTTDTVAIPDYIVKGGTSIASDSKGEIVLNCGLKILWNTYEKETSETTVHIPLTLDFVNTPCVFITENGTNNQVTLVEVTSEYFEITKTKSYVMFNWLAIGI